METAALGFIVGALLWFSAALFTENYGVLQGDRFYFMVVFCYGALKKKCFLTASTTPWKLSVVVSYGGAEIRPKPPTASHIRAHPPTQSHPYGSDAHQALSGPFPLEQFMTSLYL